MLKGIKGVSEETTTGVHRLYEMAQKGTLAFPAINVNDKRDQEQVRQPVRLSALADRRAEPRHGRDALGKGGRVCGYGDVGKGAPALKGQGCRVIVTEIDPICALQAAMEGYQVAPLEDVVAPRTSSSPRPATRTSSPRTTCGR